jgi:hypothetical protein
MNEARRGILNFPCVATCTLHEVFAARACMFLQALWHDCNLIMLAPTSHSLCICPHSENIEVVPLS